MAHRFEFKGGVQKDSAGRVGMFLGFLIFGGREVSIFDGLKTGAVSRVYDERGASTLMETSAPVLKIMIKEQKFGSQKLFQTFYLLLGGGAERQTVQITPKESLYKAMGWTFRGESRFLKKSEILEILDPNSLSAKLVATQQMLPVEVLRSIITVEKPKAVEQQQQVRRIRIN